MPEAVKNIHNPEISIKYLNDVFNAIYNNDIKMRHKILSDDSFLNITKFLINSTGSEISSSNIAKVLKSENKDADNKTIIKYIQTLINSYIFYKCERFDIKGKEHLKTLYKCYLVDTGFRGALIGKENFADRGHLLENVVYAELLRRSNQVWMGKVYQGEVDFVCKDKNGYTVYYQVAWDINNHDTLNREIVPLNNIKDNNEKIILSTDYDTSTINGIKKLNVVQWLLNVNRT